MTLSLCYIGVIPGKPELPRGRYSARDVSRQHTAHLRHRLPSQVPTDDPTTHRIGHGMDDEGIGGKIKTWQIHTADPVGN